MIASDALVRLFLRFAVPCAFVLRQRGEISALLLQKLEDAAVGKVRVSRVLLERIFKRAFVRIDRVAKEMKRKRWDPLVIREYFVTHHNRIIDRREDDYALAPVSLCKLCRMEEGKVVRVHPGAYIVTLRNGERRAVLRTFVPRANVGDRLLVHYGYAVERSE